MIRPSSRRRLAAGVAAALLAVTATPSSAQFGGVVYDPTNYAQNVLQAARALQQVNNQILSLQNEAASLVNQGRNLASLPISALQDLQGQIQQTRQLLGEAQRIAYDVRQIEQAFASQYRNLGAGTSERALVEGAQGRWENSVAAFEDALKVQAGVVGNIDGSRATLGTLVGGEGGQRPRLARISQLDQATIDIGRVRNDDDDAALRLRQHAACQRRQISDPRGRRGRRPHRTRCRGVLCVGH